MTSPCSTNCIGLETHSWKHGYTKWKPSWISHEAQARASLETLTDGDDVTIFNLPVRPPGRDCASQDNAPVVHTHTSEHICRSCYERLLSLFEFLSIWREPAYLHSNGLFSHEDKYDENGKFIGVSTVGKFVVQYFGIDSNNDGKISHHFGDIQILTNWIEATNKTQILFLRTGELAMQRIIPALLVPLQRKLAGDPLWPYITVLDDYLTLQHNATFAIGDLAKIQEKRVESPGDAKHLQPRTDYAHLHEIARHSLTVAEILRVNVRTLSDMVNCHQAFMEQDRHYNRPADKNIITQTHQRLLLRAHVAYSNCCRCESYADRVKNIIQLAFNLVSQEEAHTSVEIAKATKSDSQAMRITSLVALIFLPPTFISGIFSTTFFEFGDSNDSWRVSDKFYIYWIFVLPITLASGMLWYFYVSKNPVVLLAPRILGRRDSRKELWDVESQKEDRSSK